MVSITRGKNPTYIRGPQKILVLLGKRNKQAKDKQMTFTAIVWSKEQFVPWRCAACLLSRKDCSVMKKNK